MKFNTITQTPILVLVVLVLLA